MIFGNSGFGGYSDGFGNSHYGNNTFGHSMFGGYGRGYSPMQMQMSYNPYLTGMNYNSYLTGMNHNQPQQIGQAPSSVQTEGFLSSFLENLQAIMDKYNSPVEQASQAPSQQVETGVNEPQQTTQEEPVAVESTPSAPAPKPYVNDKSSEAAAPSNPFSKIAFNNSKNFESQEQKADVINNIAQNAKSPTVQKLIKQGKYNKAQNLYNKYQNKK